MLPHGLEHGARSGGRSPAGHRPRRRADRYGAIDRVMAGRDVRSGARCAIAGARRMKTVQSDEAVIERLPRTFAPAMREQFTRRDVLFPAEQRLLKNRTEWLRELARPDFDPNRAPGHYARGFFEGLTAFR